MSSEKKTPDVPTERKKPVFFNVTYQSFLRNVELHNINVLMRHKAMYERKLPYNERPIGTHHG